MRAILFVVLVAVACEVFASCFSYTVPAHELLGSCEKSDYAERLKCWTYLTAVLDSINSSKKSFLVVVESKGITFSDVCVPRNVQISVAQQTWVKWAIKHAEILHEESTYNLVLWAFADAWPCD